MARARKTRLTDVGVARLKPAASEFTVWDMRVPGLGVRVRPSGHRGYVYQCKVDGRAKRVTLGPAALKTVADVRRECLEIEVMKKSGDRAMSAQRQDADLRRLRRRSVEVGVLRSIQAGDAKERARLAENPAAAGLRRLAARPYRPLARPPLVRRIQPHRAGRRQPRARHLPPDHEPRHRPRPCRGEPHP